MNTEKVEQKLRTRGLNQTTFSPLDEDEDWVVWLWCADDPGLGTFVGHGSGYDEALREALQVFDLHQKTNVELEEKQPAVVAPPAE